MATDYQHYQVRISRPWSDVSGVILNLYKKAQSGFVFQHDADEEVNRTHIHAYMFNINLKYDAISDRVKKLGFKGNSDFAISGSCGGKMNRRPLDVSGAWIYGTKEEALRPVWVENISPAIVEGLVDGARRFYAKRENTCPKPNLNVVKAKTLTKYQHVREIAAQVLSPEFLKLGMDERVKVIKEHTVRYLNQNQIFCGLYHTLEWIECVIRDIDQETFEHALHLKLEKNLGILI